MRTLALLACLAAADAQTREAPRVSSVLTVCQVLADPLTYDGHTITLRGPVQGTDEGTWLVGDYCPGVIVTEGHVWPTVVALVAPPLPPSLHLHSVDFDYDRESERKMAAKYVQLQKSGIPKECIYETFTGLFETRRDWSAAKLVYADGTSKFAGFGHLGQAPGQLILRSVDDVVAESGCSKAVQPKPRGNAENQGKP